MFLLEERKRKYMRKESLCSLRKGVIFLTGHSSVAVGALCYKPDEVKAFVSINLILPASVGPGGLLSL
jgi:hypothetical protein